MLMFGEHMSIFALSTRFPIGVFSSLHLLKQLKVLFYALLSARAFFTGAGQSPSIFLHLFGVKIADISLALFNQFHRCLVHLIKVVGGPKALVPLPAQPSYVFFDGVNILHIFFDRIGVVISQITLTAVFLLP